MIFFKNYNNFWLHTFFLFTQSPHFPLSGSDGQPRMRKRALCRSIYIFNLCPLSYCPPGWINILGRSEQVSYFCRRVTRRHVMLFYQRVTRHRGVFSTIFHASSPSRFTRRFFVLASLTHYRESWRGGHRVPVPILSLVCFRVNISAFSSVKLIEYHYLIIGMSIFKFKSSSITFKVLFKQSNCSSSILVINVGFLRRITIIHH